MRRDLTPTIASSSLYVARMSRPVECSYTCQHVAFLDILRRKINAVRERLACGKVDIE